MNKIRNTFSACSELQNKTILLNMDPVDIFSCAKCKQMQLNFERLQCCNKLLWIKWKEELESSSCPYWNFKNFTCWKDPVAEFSVQNWMTKWISWNETVYIKYLDQHNTFWSKLVKWKVQLYIKNLIQNFIILARFINANSYLRLLWVY